MENNKCDKCQDGCECSSCNGAKGCGCHHGHCDGVCFGHHRTGRWVIKVLVLLFVFWVGTQVGEMKSEFRSQYGYPMGAYRMQGYQGYNAYGSTDAARQGGGAPAASSTPRE